MRKFALIELVAGLALVGCGTASSTNLDASAMATVGSDTDAGPTSDAGPSYPIEYDCTEPCTIRWRELAPLDQPLDHHSTFIIERTDGPYLYVLGGIRPTAVGDGVESYSPRVLAARILEDGTLGPWEANDFGYGIAFHSQAQYVSEAGEDRLMWIGGVLLDPADMPVMPGASSYTFIGSFPQGEGPGIAGIRVGEGTNLSRLRAELALPVMHATAAVRERAGEKDLFLIGGSRGNSLTSDVLHYIAETSSWVMDTALPRERSHHALVQIDRRLVLLGGFAGTTTSPVGDPSILRSVHDEAGYITGWEEIGTLDEPPWTTAAFVRNGFLYIVGGGISGGHHGNGEFLDRVRRAPIEADGHIGTFEDITPLPLARGHVHQTPIHGNYIYSVGGRIRTETGTIDATARIFVGTFVE